MQVTEELRAWMENQSGCRYPRIAWVHLDRARKALPSVRPSPDPDHNRTNFEMMQVLEDAAVSILASASAIETHILLMGFFMRREIRLAEVDSRSDEANTLVEGFTGQFVSWAERGGKKIALSDLAEGDQVHTRNPRDLHCFARWVTEAIGTRPQWPAKDALKKLRKTRNLLVHETVRPCAREGATLTLMEDFWECDLGDGTEGIVGFAEVAFKLMMTCCHDILRDAAKKGWDKHADPKVLEKTRRAVTRRLREQGRS